jgi:heme/copper-type cytochrome/quinol oxidase subunit 1
MWRYIALTLKPLLTTGLSIVAVFVSGIVSVLIRTSLRVRNHSGVGPEYYNEEITTVVGLLVFLILLLGLLYLLQRTLSRNLQWLPYLVAVITCICSAGFLAVMFFW